MQRKHASPPKRRAKRYDANKHARLFERVRQQCEIAVQIGVHMRSIVALDASKNEAIPAPIIRTILINGWWALGALTNIDGRGTRQDWETLADAMNQSRVLCAEGFGPEHSVTLDAALAGLFRSETQAVGNAGQWGLDGDAEAAIVQALPIYEAQLESIVQGDLARALVLIDQRLADEQFLQ
ncbi:hypothetical protein [Cupriavidus pauculus]|uniref:hypothetical protein n=1 Tax=Cupriavidus pauculus TaxID=82633 RepID=UPI001D0C8D75|nr:hypothetical protein [Cupriavidus pauculus]